MEISHKTGIKCVQVIKKNSINTVPLLAQIFPKYEITLICSQVSVISFFNEKEIFIFDKFH